MQDIGDPRKHIDQEEARSPCYQYLVRMICRNMVYHCAYHLW